METVQDRLRLAMKSAGVSQTSLAEGIGLAQPSISAFMKSPADEWAPLVKAARYLRVRPEWLQFGDGPMVASNQVATGITAPGLVEIGRDEFVAIGRYDARLSAGPGCIVEEHPEPLGFHLIENQWLRSVTSAMPDSLAVVRVDGDSMDPTLKDGDWVLVDRTQTKLNREGVYALAVGDVTWVKRITLNLRERLVRIVSDNERYPLQEMEEDELVIVGRVIWVVARKL